MSDKAPPITDRPTVERAMSELAERLLERLTETDGGQKFPTVRPRDAATMIIIDRSGATPKVLLSPNP